MNQKRKTKQYVSMSTMYLSKNLNIHIFCTISYKFMKAYQDKSRKISRFFLVHIHCWICKYIPYKNNDNVGQLKMLCSSSRVNHLHCEDDCTANDYNLKNAVICCVSLSNTVQLRSWAFALIAVSNTAEYRVQIF